jgi:hypothetical protein
MTAVSDDYRRIRPATDRDRELIGRIASLDSSGPIEEPALIGELVGIPVAVLSLTDGRVVADPFRHTADLVAAMRVRAKALGARDQASLTTRLRAALRRPRSAYLAT